ncbi:MAG TPA: ATP phosphoribosyltransferase [Bellilinea sp.]|nr:ATP phosphoribosyltransferase [Bellilinea sp.]
MNDQWSGVRLGLPSKGPLGESTLALLDQAGMKVVKPSLRQYVASVPTLPGLTVLFQRPGDLVTSVREGSLDFCITGLDVYAEQISAQDPVIPIHAGLGYGHCTLNLIVPEMLQNINSCADLAAWQQSLERPLRVATKFPNVTRGFLQERGLQNFELIHAEGTLEIAPTIGSADLIADLVSSGNTLRENHLKRLADGQILASQACLIANKNNLKNKPEALRMARQILEFIVAYLRASECVSVFVNMRGESPESIAELMFTQPLLSGLQGPTISPVIAPSRPEKWFAAHLVVRKARLSEVIGELRQIGGSGVVVSPVSYIFEEEPLEYRQMIARLEEEA